MNALKITAWTAGLLLLVGPILAQDQNPDNINDWRGKTVMVFSPHPDDDLASAGTMAKLVANGNTVYM